MEVRSLYPPRWIGLVDRARRKPSEQASTPETNRIEIAGHIAQT